MTGNARTGLTESGGPSASKWLVDLVGVDYFSHVTQVRLVATPELSEKEIVLIFATQRAPRHSTFTGRRSPIAASRSSKD